MKSEKRKSSSSNVTHRQAQGTARIKDGATVETLCAYQTDTVLYACNETNLMHYLCSVYSVTIPLHVSGLLVAHHQEVVVYKRENSYLYVLVDFGGYFICAVPCACLWVTLLLLLLLPFLFSHVILLNMQHKSHL
jgi:hypothetical protein